MSFNPNLQIGQTIDSNTLMDIFKCSNGSGIRRSLTTDTLVIISDNTKSLYTNKWIDNVFHYTGMGLEGDQDINYKQNKTVNESNETSIPMFLFEVFKKNEYIYRGQVKLIDTPYQEIQDDKNGNPRNVWIFPLSLLDESTIPKVVLDEYFEEKEKKLKKLSDKELEEKTKKTQSKKVSIRTTTTKTYDRNPYVSTFAKRKANGICQLCGENAPFLNKNKEPYLETHHIEWLSQGGADTIENTIALCPNCHKKMHVVNDEKDKEFLKKKVDLYK